MTLNSITARTYSDCETTISLKCIDSAGDGRDTHEDLVEQVRLVGETIKERQDSISHGISSCALIDLEASEENAQCELADPRRVSLIPWLRRVDQVREWGAEEFRVV